jgi:hypothetical protein
MTSSEALKQIQSVQGQLDPLLSAQGQVPSFMKDEINKKFNYGMPLLKEGAGLEAGAYALPGQLMEKYNAEFGNTLGGASSQARMNSMLGRLGNQFGLADLASGLADRQGARMNDLASSLTQQYGATIQGLKDKYNMTMPLYQTLKSSEESALNRARMGGGGGGVSSSPLSFTDWMKWQREEEERLRQAKASNATRTLSPYVSAPTTTTKYAGGQNVSFAPTAPRPQTTTGALGNLYRFGF